jgi:hypothetical protein
LSKSPFFKRFIHLATQLRVGRQFPPIFALAKSHDPEKADIHSTLRQKLYFSIETTRLFSTRYEKQNPHHHHMFGKNDKTPQTTSINESVLCNWNESI